jgi:hypothetical protein
VHPAGERFERGSLEQLAGAVELQRDLVADGIVHGV